MAGENDTIPGMEVSLKDELNKHRGQSVMLGMRSSFFYVGPCDEALNCIKSIGIVSRFCAAMGMNKDPSKFLASYPDDDGIGSMKVIKVYRRDLGRGDEGTVIIVDGREFGMFWTRDEYLEARSALREKMSELFPSTCQYDVEAGRR